MMNLKSKFLLVVLLSFPLIGQSLKCGHCGKAIEYKYIIYEGVKYHESCYKNYVQLKCADCDEPIDGKFIIRDGKQYHERCYNEKIAFKCNLCDGIINGTYTTDYWGNNYHSFHVDKEVRCDYCDRFISAKLTRGGSKYSDGRVICNICNSTSVSSLAKAKTIFNKVRLSLANIGVRINHNQINLQLVNKNELKSVSFEHGNLSDPRGFAKYTYYKRGNEITSRAFTVYLLNGMPEKDFEAAAAHELMHVWQYENAPDNLEPQLAEGSAEYISYLHMKKQKGKYSEYILNRIENNYDTVYGGGFRKIKQIVDYRGLNFLLNHLRKSNQLPRNF